MFSIALQGCLPTRPSKNICTGVLRAEAISIVACATIAALVLSGVIAAPAGVAYTLIAFGALETIALIALQCLASRRRPSPPQQSAGGAAAAAASAPFERKPGVTYYAAADVAKHSTEKDCWMIIDGKVYDVTKFIDQHPGGEEVLLDQAGRDGTAEFDDVGHSDEAMDMLKEYCIGDFDPT